MEDIRFFHNKFGIKSFWFTHDAFTANMELVEKLCDYIIDEDLDITWKCTTRIDRIDRDLILKMKRAGLVQIELGVETGSDRMQKIINKNLRLNTIDSNIQFLLEQKIAVSLFFMYGFPEETEQDLFDTVQLSLDLLDRGIKHVSMSFCRFNPTTQITEDCFDKLVLNPNIDSLFRDVYAYTDEFEVIAKHKPLFTYYYNLDTELRQKYQYLIYFLYLYEKLPSSAHHLKAAFAGDAGKFLRTFFEVNRDRLTCGINTAKEWFIKHPGELIERVLEQAECPQAPQLRALVQFDFDREQVARQKEDCTFVKEYAFCYSDLKQGRKLSEYGEGTSKVLFQRKDGAISIMLVK